MRAAAIPATRNVVIFGDEVPPTAQKLRSGNASRNSVETHASPKEQTEKRKVCAFENQRKYPHLEGVDQVIAFLPRRPRLTTPRVLRSAVHCAAIMDIALPVIASRIRMGTYDIRELHEENGSQRERTECQ